MRILNLNTIFFTTISLLISGIVIAAPVEKLGDSEELGLNEEPRGKKTPKSRPNEKISNLGDGVYIRQFNDYGQPTVEVHPEAGPSYYYNENEINEPATADGVYDRQTPSWMIKEW